MLKDFSFKQVIFVMYIHAARWYDNSAMIPLNNNHDKSWLKTL